MSTRGLGNRLAKLLCALTMGIMSTASWADDKADVIQVPAFEVPRFSAYMSEETKAGVIKGRQLYEKAASVCNKYEMKDGASIRACEAKVFPPIIAEARKIYDVNIQPQEIAGIYTDVVTPAEGVPEKNRNRVLINMHGGGFKYGARFGGQLEAMPIAAIGKYKVVAVDYRMAPEHRFPAASIDVEKVYRELLKRYPPENIGIYGCSAGGRLTGEAIAWFHKEGLPSPGAAAILCSAPTRLDGDTNYYANALMDRKPRTVQDVKYWEGVAEDDPLAFPGESMEMLAIFPPSLLMTSTRDYSVSPMVSMHSKLVRLGVETELHMFEGFFHAGFLNMYVPEAKEAAKTVGRFFDKHLGTAMK